MKIWKHLQTLNKVCFLLQSANSWNPQPEKPSLFPRFPLHIFVPHMQTIQACEGGTILIFMKDVCHFPFCTL